MRDERCKCVSMVGVESGESMSLSEEFLLQQFVYVICSMSPFPPVHCVMEQIGGQCSD